MKYLRDLVEVQYNAAGDDDQFPVWRTLLQRVPCEIKSATGGASTGGGETITADQQAAQNEYSVLMWYLYRHRIGGNHRLCVLVGPFEGMLLEVVTTGDDRPAGRQGTFRMTCRELEVRRAV